jgi:hypothetical protein
MIKRAVFSYFNPDESFSNKAGFKNYSDFLYSMTLATYLAMRHFEDVQIVTSSWGVKVLKAVGIPATQYTSELDSIKGISKWFWAYGKLVAYTKQTEPFVHIDNDVFLWKPLPQRILDAELCFQSKEIMNVPNYKWYDVLRPSWDHAKVRPQIIVDNEVTDFAYNCGICGGHNLSFFKEWIKCSSEYIFAPENQSIFFENFKNVLMHQNLFHEQYFAASLIKAHQMRDQVQVISDDATDLVKNTDNGYSHLWGGIKKQDRVGQLVKARLSRECPELYNKVTAFVNEYLFQECQIEKAEIQQ